jgi:hypothetical protein
VGDLQRELHRLRTARGKVTAVQWRRGQVGDQPCELKLWLVDEVARAGEREPRRLRRDRFGDLGDAVADRDDVDAARRVEVAAAVGVLDPDTLAADGQRARLTPEVS